MLWSDKTVRCLVRDIRCIGQVAEVFGFIHVVVKLDFERSKVLRNIPESGGFKKFILFEFDITRYNDFLSFRIPKSIHPVADISK